ncbi:MAG TPA: hypothetical protein VM712_01215 [Gaiellales bacterium]|nr:hypothetical protein [Gaiellales bacterium]
MIDLDALHQKPDQLATLMPAQVRQPVVHATGEILQPTKDERQGVPLRRVVPQGFALRFPRLDPPPEASDPRLELGPLDQAFGIAVDQTTHAAAQLRKLRLDGCEGEAVRAIASRHLEPTLILRRDPRRVMQHLLDLLPDGGIQQIGAQRRVRAHAEALGAANVAAAAPVVGVGPAPASR